MSEPISPDNDAKIKEIIRRRGVIASQLPKAPAGKHKTGFARPEDVRVDPSYFNQN